MRLVVDGEHVLPDGTTVHIRSIRPDDHERVLALWQRLSHETIHSRFFGIVRLDDVRAREWVEVDPAVARSIVATLGRGADERIIAMARYDRLPESPTSAEFSALVEDAYQGHGIGTALLRCLVAQAQDDGIGSLTGDVLRGNLRMLALLRDLGVPYVPTRDGSLVHTEFRAEATEVFLDGVARDEKAAAVAALQRFLHPASVAVVGASRNPTSIGGLLFANLLAGGFNGPIYPVNPSAAAVQSVAAYPTLAACPTVPDLVFVCVPAGLVGAVVDEAGRLGTRAVCVISAGFAETDAEGAARQDELLRVARAHGLRLIGPNCMGLLNGADDVRLNGTFSRQFPTAGNVSFLSQSGALGLSVLGHLDDLGLGIATFVSVGNKADLSGNDLLLYWEDDLATEVILLYIESFGNPRKFSRIARRIARRKPIVAVKAGRTVAGQRAASSHTAALAAGDVAVDALFQQTGVIRTDSLEQLFGVTSLLCSQPAPRGRRVAILTNGGGPGILAADACESFGLEVPPLSPQTCEQLAAFLPPEAGIANPVDMIASTTAAQYGRAVRVLGSADEVDAIIVIFIPPIVTRADDVARALVRARAALPDDTPLLTVFMGAKGVPSALAEARIPSYAFPEDAAHALSLAAKWNDWRRQPQGSVRRPRDVDADGARAVVAATLDGRPDDADAWLDGPEAARLLRTYGIPLAAAVTVTTAAEAAAAQRQIGGPVALKLNAPIHKVDVGGVALDLKTPEAAADALTAMRERLTAGGLGHHTGSFLVQQMITDGVEMAVGVTHDPLFGPLIMAGLGGSLVELMRDVAVRVTPVTDVDVEHMLAQLRGYPLLRGYRGTPPLDVEAFKDLIHRIDAMVEDVPEIVELDLNPVFVRPRGVVVADVRLRVQRVRAPSLPDALTEHLPLRPRAGG
jgi:acetate---CoA ligase (ADP-forming)